jgi:hypothetical protein
MSKGRQRENGGLKSSVFFKKHNPKAPILTFSPKVADENDMKIN